jgi:hypothetical protein
VINALTQRRVTLVSIIAGIVLSCALVWGSSTAAFNSYTTNPGNAWASGTLSLGDDDSNGVLFSVTGLRPGDTGSRCLRVTYTGSARSNVRLYTTASSYTGSLGAYIDLVISEGTTGSYANGTCSDWTTGTSLYTGLMSAFSSASTTFSNGKYNTADPWSPITSGQYKVYKFDYTLRLDAPTGAQNTSGGIGFTWEAQSTPNLALAGTATGSTACASQEPYQAIDGSVASGSKFCSTAGTKTLQVDLGSAKTIAGYVVRHAGAGGESSTLNTKDYDIEVSSNASTWTNPVQVRGNTADVTASSITAISRRYVRVTVITAEQSANTTARIYELEIYGS